MQLGYRAVTTDYYMQQKYGMTAAQVVAQYNTCNPEATVATASGTTTQAVVRTLNSTAAIPTLPSSGILSTSSSPAYKVVAPLCMAALAQLLVSCIAATPF